MIDFAQSKVNLRKKNILIFYQDNLKVQKYNE